LIGCVPVVVLSWVLILKDEFVSPVKPPVAEAKR
jgi:hypothetical protein